MKFKKIMYIGLATLSLGLGLSLAGNTAQAAKHYVTTPTSLRGTWYHYDSDYGYSKLHVTKYHFKTGGINLSGNKFPKYARGHAQMFVYKNSKGYYNIGAYASDQWPYWKRVSHKGHSAIRQLTFMGPGYATDYWYKTKSIAKHPQLRHSLDYYKKDYRKIIATKTVKTTHYKYNYKGKLVSKKPGRTFRKGQSAYVIRTEGTWLLRGGSNKYKGYSTNYDLANAANSRTWFKDKK